MAKPAPTTTLKKPQLETKAIQTKPEQAVAKVETSTAVAIHDSNNAFAEFENAGLENIKSTDILIPRISILQDLSPQVKDNKPEYIQGAKVGMICDVGTGQLIGDELIFVPVHYMKVWLEWYPRKSGKGLAAIHGDPDILDRCTVNDKRQYTTEDGNLVSETAQLFGLDITNGSISQVFLPFSSTQIKKCKRLLFLATSERIQTSKGEITPPLFYRSYIMTSVAESNSEGDWHGWKIERGLPIPELPNFKAVMESAIKMRKQIESGIVKADMSGEEEEHSAARKDEGAM